jgi:hypothetical protein
MRHPDIFHNSPVKQEEIEKLGWNFEEIDRGLLYWNADEDKGHGFNFAFLTFYSEDDNGAYLDNVVHGYAHWDGLRHLYFGAKRDEDNPTIHDHLTDQEGYIYYPGSFIKLFTRLEEIQKEYCNPSDCEREW